MKTARITAIMLASAAAGLLPDVAQAQVVNACVNRNTGDVRINATGGACPSNAYALQWNQPQSVGVPPPPELHLQIIAGWPIEGTWMSRAFCPATWKVTGGGALTRNGSALRYSMAIQSTDGEIAGNENAIGWQAAAVSEDDVFVYVHCAKVY